MITDDICVAEIRIITNTFYNSNKFPALKGEIMP